MSAAQEDKVPLMPDFFALAIAVVPVSALAFASSRAVVLQCLFLRIVFPLSLPFSPTSHYLSSTAFSMPSWQAEYDPVSDDGYESKSCFAEDDFKTGIDFSAKVSFEEYKKKVRGDEGST